MLWKPKKLKLFAADIKVSSRLDHNCSSLKDAISLQVSLVLNFQVNTDLLETLENMWSIGTLAAYTSGLHTPILDAEITKSPDPKEKIIKSVLNKTFSLLLQPELFSHKNGKTVDISGCEFMPDGEMVTIRVWNSSFSFKGFRIWLYQFLIIAYLFTLHLNTTRTRMACHQLATKWQ